MDKHILQLAAYYVIYTWRSLAVVASDNNKQYMKRLLAAAHSPN